MILDSIPTMALRASQYRRLHRQAAAPAIADVFANDADWTASAAALAALGEAPPLADDMSAVDETTSTLLAAAEDGAGLATPAVAASCGVIITRHSTAGIVAAAHSRAQQILIGRFDSAVAALVPDVLTALNTSLATIVDRARPLVDLVDLDDPADALETNRRDEFHELRNIATEYANLRRVQRDVLADVGLLEADARQPEAWLMPDTLGAFPHWAHWHVNRRDPDGKPLAAPWPEQVGAVRNMLGADPAFFTWAVRADVALWVPTVEQYDQACAKLNDTVAAVRYPDGTTKPAMESGDRWSGKPAEGSLIL